MKLYFKKQSSLLYKRFSKTSHSEINIKYLSLLEITGFREMSK